MSEPDPNNPRDLIESIRGVYGQERILCSACNLLNPLSNVEPEEGGEWWCRGCIAQWEKETGCHWHNGQPKTP